MNTLYYFICGIIFALVALAHLARILNDAPVVLGGWPVPMIVSWAAFILSGLMSWWSFVLTREHKGS